MLPPPHRDPDATKVGPDFVRLEAGAVVIYSKRDMPDWVVREFKRPAIWFKEHKFYLRARTETEWPFRWRYLLCPWPENRPEPPAYEIHYDEAYVRQSEDDWRRSLAAASVHWSLHPFSVLLGFLWSGTKDRLADYGFDARAITSHSVLLEFGFMAFWAIYVGYFLHASWLNVGLLLVLVADVLFRYDAVLRDQPLQPGFLEWVFRR